MQQVARQAQIADFTRPLKGYNSFVGERGIFLSGGQRQRTGIAVHLQKSAGNRQATSALDNATKQSVIKAIEGSENNHHPFIAHRLTTIKINIT